MKFLIIPIIQLNTQYHIIDSIIYSFGINRYIERGGEYMGIHEIITRLEHLRKKRILLNGAITGVVIVFMIFIFFGQTSRELQGLIMLAPFIMLGVVVALLHVNTGITKEYKKLYKETFVKAVLSETFDNVEYYWEKGFDQNAVKGFALTRLGNIFRSEDYLRARYKGINFEQADVTIKYKTHGKNSHTTTYFKGRMFVFDVPEKSVVSVQVFSSNYLYRAGTIEKFKMNKVQMESEHFNKEFDVNAMNMMDAFLVLTPQMMERIQKIKYTYGNIGMHFHGNKLYVGINMQGDAFDGSLNRKIDYYTEKQATMRDVQVIKDIIDTMGMENENFDNSNNSNSFANSDSTIKYSIPYNR